MTSDLEAKLLTRKEQQALGYNPEREMPDDANDRSFFWVPNPRGNGGGSFREEGERNRLAAPFEVGDLEEPKTDHVWRIRIGYPRGFSWLCPRLAIFEAPETADDHRILDHVAAEIALTEQHNEKRRLALVVAHQEIDALREKMLVQPRKGATVAEIGDRLLEIIRAANEVMDRVPKLQVRGSSVPEWPRLPWYKVRKKFAKELGAYLHGKSGFFSSTQWGVKEIRTPNVEYDETALLVFHCAEIIGLEEKTE